MFGAWPRPGATERRLSERNGLEDLILEIEAAIQGNAHYLALVASLTLPDVCCALASEEGKTSAARYMAWWDEWMAPKYSVEHTPSGPPVPKKVQVAGLNTGWGLTGATAWDLRNGILHKGRGKGDARTPFVRTLFAVGAHNSVMSPTDKDPALVLDPIVFCQDLIVCARAWWEAHKDDRYVRDNWPRLLKRYPEGMDGYILGTLVIG